MADEPLAAALGARITSARRALGLTKTALAERLNLPVGTVDRLERGVTDPLPHLVGIADAIGKDVDDLWNGGARAEPPSLRVTELAQWERRLRNAETELSSARAETERRSIELKQVELNMAAAAAKHDYRSAVLNAEAARLEAHEKAQREADAALERRASELTAREEALVQELAELEEGRKELARAKRDLHEVVNQIRTLVDDT